MNRLTLSLIRHAHADPAGILQEDKIRPLSIQGINHIAPLGESMLKFNRLPEIAIVSPAKRAQETFVNLCEILTNKIDSETIPCIYDGDLNLMIEQIKIAHKDYHHVAVVGHNPLLSKLASVLAQKNIVLNPSGWVCMEANLFDIDGTVQADIIAAHEVIIY